MNVLESRAYIGSLTVWSLVSANERIGLGTMSLTTLSNLTENSFSNCSVIRSVTWQGQNSNFTVKFMTNAILLDQSVITVGLPINQIWLQAL